MGQSRRLYECALLLYPTKSSTRMSSGETNQETQAEAILSQMSGFMTGLREFKDEITCQQEELVRVAIKRSRQERPYAFWRPGNVAQYMEHVREAFWHLEKVGGTKAEAALKELKEGEALLTRRMRLIKITDRSDHGWNTIAAYENDELALDSEDEKKLLRAEKEAEKRVTRKKSKAATTSAAPLVTTGDVAPRRLGVVLPARVGPCFGCGELGHLSQYSSKSAATRSSVSGATV